MDHYAQLFNCLDEAGNLLFRRSVAHFGLFYHAAEEHDRQDLSRWNRRTKFLLVAVSQVIDHHAEATF